MLGASIKKIIGVFLILLGIIGLFLPILQGVLLILAGLFLFDRCLYDKVKARLGAKV